MDSAYGRVHVGTGMDSAARRACWPTATVAGLPAVADGQRAGLWPARLALPMLARDRHRGGQAENIMHSLQRGHKT